jgi:hypothetical protein
MLEMQEFMEDPIRKITKWEDESVDLWKSENRERA